MHKHNIAAGIASGEQNPFVQNKLQKAISQGYIRPAIAKSVAGRRNPSNLTATQHAPSVFFYVAASAHLNFRVWRSRVFFFLKRQIRKIMVVQAGQLSGWPVFVRAGIPTPVWATTSFGRRNPGGSVTRYLTEVAIWPLPQLFITSDYSACLQHFTEQLHPASCFVLTLSPKNQQPIQPKFISWHMLFPVGRKPAACKQKGDHYAEGI